MCRASVWEMCFVIADVAARASETYEEGDIISINAPEYPTSAQLFGRAAKSFEDSGSGMRQIAELADAANLIARSYRHHCIGEVHHFKSEYAAAHDFRQNAHRELHLCVANCGALVKRGCSSTTRSLDSAN